MYGVYYFGFYDYGGARVVVFPPFGKVWKPSLTTLTTTAITEKDHIKAGGNHNYIRQKGQVIIKV